MCPIVLYMLHTLIQPLIVWRLGLCPIVLYMLHTASHCLEVGPVPNSSMHAAYSLSLFGGWVGPNSSIHGASKAL